MPHLGFTAVVSVSASDYRPKPSFRYSIDVAISEELGSETVAT